MIKTTPIEFKVTFDDKTNPVEERTYTEIFRGVKAPAEADLIAYAVADGLGDGTEANYTVEVLFSGAHADIIHKNLSVATDNREDYVAE